MLWQLVVVWLIGNGVAHINEVALRQPGLVLGWVTVIPSWYLTSHPGLLTWPSVRGYAQ